MERINFGGTIRIKECKLYGYINISRPLNVVIAFISIGMGAVLAGSLQPVTAVMAACISGALITAAANAMNDVFDVEIDTVNKPNRPLPCKILSLQEAKIFSFILFVAGICFAFFINVIAFAVAVVFSVLLYLYSAYLKRMVLWGNAMVSLATGVAFIYGGIAVGQVKYAIFPAIFAFFMHFAREIIKDIEDVKGDRHGKANTLVVVYGIKPGQWLITILLIILAGMTLVPFFIEIYNRYYLWIVLAGVYTVLFYTVLGIWIRTTCKHMRFLSKLLKVDMLVGLVALYIGRL